MMYHEFMERTGLQVTEEEFDEINDIYMNCGFSIDNPAFCKNYRHDDPIIKGLYSELKRCQRMYKLMKAAYFNLTEYGNETKESRKCASEAVGGEQRYIKEKLTRGVEMNEDDISWLKENL